MDKETVRERRVRIHTHTQEYYSAIKRMTSLGMDLEEIMLSEIRQRKTNNTENRLVVAIVRRHEVKCKKKNKIHCITDQKTANCLVIYDHLQYY